MKTYQLNQSQLYRLSNRTKLAKMLGLPKNYFRKQIYIDDQYKDKLVDKKNGAGKRMISCPRGKEVALIQAKLFYYLNRIERPDWVKSSKRGESYITNATAHKKYIYGMKTDISKFYDSVAYGRVRRLFLDKFEMSSDIAEIMTIITTHYRKIPTGGAASMLVAYFTYEDMFRKIQDFSQKNSVMFTLYVDDLSFSSDTPIGKEFFLAIRNIVFSYGLKAKWSKTCFYSARSYREYTGVGIDKYGNLMLPNRRRKAIIDCYKDCITNAQDVSKLNRLGGMLNAARQIEPEIFPQICAYARKRQ